MVRIQPWPPYTTMFTKKYIEHCQEHIEHNNAIIADLSTQIARSTSEAVRIILEEEQHYYRAENVLLRHNIENEQPTTNNR